MKNYIFSLILVVLMMFMTGCGDKTTRITPPCYILSYIELARFEVVHPSKYCKMDMDFPFVMVQHHHKWDSSQGFDIYQYNYWDNRADNSWFIEEFSNKYGDTSYYEELKFVVVPPADHTYYLTPDMRDISLVCSSDYDAAHPSGTDLGDIIRYSGCSLYPFIKNGYIKTGLSDVQVNCQADSIMLDFIAGRPFSPVFKSMNDLTEEDLYLNGQYIDAKNRFSCFCLTFMSLPDEKGVHDFTLTMNGDDGKVYTTEFSYDFGGAE